jgi:hypothetical protein
MFAAVAGKDDAIVAFDVDCVFGERYLAATVAEKTNGEKEAGRKGIEDVRLSCCFREVREIERSGESTRCVYYWACGQRCWGEPDNCECTSCRS